MRSKMSMPKGVKIDIHRSDDESEFFMEIERDSLENILLSIAHKRLSNRGSGLVRNTGYPSGVRTVQDVTLTGVYEGDRADARIYHDSYIEHAASLGLIKDGKSIKTFCIMGNANLLNNPWNVAWQVNKDNKIYCLKDEPLDSRVYSCFAVFKSKHIAIERFSFRADSAFVNRKPDYLGPANRTFDLEWATYGQQIVRDGNIVPIEEIVDQFYDIRHVFDWPDYGPQKEENLKKLNEFYGSGDFREKALAELKKGTPRAKYLHSILGLKDNKVVIAHSYGLVEDIAKRLVEKGVRDAIILDNGGSVGAYASWLYPTGGFLNAQSHFRDDRISTIAFVFK